MLQLVYVANCLCHLLKCFPKICELELVDEPFKSCIKKDSLSRYMDHYHVIWVIIMVDGSLSW